ncbi:MAG TPA: CPBP family intramembrane glutamic endopeptidase [Thermoanaerobaculia bacterium]|nr:CPBP family intramembrane glutamic endopeptidase [Thermoanaerobaculia bacterium]
MSTAVLLFACLFPTFATWLYFIQLSGTAWAMYAYAGTKTVQFSLPVIWIWTKGGPRHPQGRGGTGTGLLLSLLSGLAIVAILLLSWRAVLAASPAFERAPAAVAAKVASFGIDSGAKFFLLAAFYSVIHSFLEEYYWRWFVFGGLRRRLPLGTAMIVSALAFTSHHVLVVGHFLGSFGFLTFAVSLIVTAAGLLWAWLYHRTGHLAGPWLSHALADAGLMWIGYQMWIG